MAVGPTDISASFISRFTPGFRLLKKGRAVMLQESTLEKIGKILRDLSKTPDRPGQVQFELKMRPLVRMRVTPEPGWDFHSQVSSMQAVPFLRCHRRHFKRRSGGLTQAAGIALVGAGRVAPAV